ncbi:MAG: helix-turn-helix transcriptional regulator [Clostridia bacterium]|nr:helix-turn-helix transcriptional regulator [Clostridia bacterium]
MTQQENIRERASRFASIWTGSRADAGKTQEYMAKGLGVSVKTIRNWESGATSPDFFTGCEWFRVLGMNPLPYYLTYLFPTLFDGDGTPEDDRIVSESLASLVRDLSPLEKKELLFLMAGRHGSPWYSLLQMFTAHCQTSMRSRVNAARIILENYEMEQATDSLVCADSVTPDLAMLRNAIEQGKRSVINGTPGYTNVVPGQDDPSENT